MLFDEFLRLVPLVSDSNTLLNSREGSEEVVIGSTLVLRLSAETWVRSNLSDDKEAEAVTVESGSQGESPNECKWRLESEDADDARFDNDNVEELLEFEEDDDEDDLFSERRDEVEEEREEREDEILNRLLMVKDVTGRLKKC